MYHLLHLNVKCLSHVVANNDYTISVMARTQHTQSTQLNVTSRPVCCLFQEL